MTPTATADDGGEQHITDDFDHGQTLQRGCEQTVWTVHESPVVETTDSAFGEPECRWTLRVYQDGAVETSRTIPYNGQRYYSTEDRRNRADKTSIYRLTVEEILARHMGACIDAGGDPDKRDEYVTALRERVLAVLRRDDVAANNNGEVGLLADGGEGAGEDGK